MATSIADIINSLEQAREQANAANEQRYNEGLQMLEGGRESMRDHFANAASLIQDIGRSAAEDVARGSQRSLAQGRQDLISRGLGNTTIQSSLRRGVEEDRRRGMERVEDQERAAKSGLEQQRAASEFGAAGTITDFIASRSDTGPDPSLYANLVRSAQSANTDPVQAAVPARSPSSLGAFGSQSIGNFGSGGGGGGGSIGGLVRGGSGGQGTAYVISGGTNNPSSVNTRTMGTKSGGSISSYTTGSGSGGSGKSAVLDKARNIQRQTGGGLIANDSTIRFSEKYGMSPKKYLQKHSA